MWLEPSLPHESSHHYVSRGVYNLGLTFAVVLEQEKIVDFCNHHALIPGLTPSTRWWPHQTELQMETSSIPTAMYPTGPTETSKCTLVVSGVDPDPD